MESLKKFSIDAIFKTFFDFFEESINKKMKG